MNAKDFKLGYLAVFRGAMVSPMKVVGINIDSDKVTVEKYETRERKEYPAQELAIYEDFKRGNQVTTHREGLIVMEVENLTSTGMVICSWRTGSKQKLVQQEFDPTELLPYEGPPMPLFG